MDLQDVLAKTYKEKGDKFILNLKYLNVSYDDLSEFFKLNNIESFWITAKSVFDSGGWGQGYVRIVEGHPLYEVEYYDYEVNEPYVHGGITWSEWGLPNGENKDYWYIGFDTQHYGDNIEIWNKKAVIDETINLFCDVYHIKR